MHPTDAPPESGRMTLFHQDFVPADLRLPTPGDPFARTAAGATDLAIAGATGAAVAYGVELLTGSADMAMSVFQGTALAHWIFRDALADGGNRSFGKRLFKQEVTYWDGTLASPGHAALRNWYFLGLPLASLHPIVGMTWSVMVVFDVASVFFTQDARKLGDYLFGTRVVNERPGRDVRLLDMAESDEVRAIRAEIERLSPGLLGSSKSSDVTGRWYEDLQTELAGDIARQAKILGKTKGIMKPVASPGNEASSSVSGGTAAAAGGPMPPLPSPDDLPDFLKAETRQVLHTHKPKKPSEGRS